VLATLGGATIANAQAIGTVASDRARVREITGDTMRLALRPDSSLGAFLSPLYRGHLLDHVPLAIVGPDIRVTWNSTIPFSQNDGALWAGRGWNVSLATGLSSQRHYRNADIRAVVAPSLLYSQNLPFQIAPNTVPGRSDYASPFHGPGASLDLPQRFGDRYLLTVDAGRSALEVEWPRVTVGATAQNEWWGPGIRNAILMSNNAPGIPRLYARTTRPVRTRWGTLEAKLMTGTLTKSRFFSVTESENRTISGVLFQFRPAVDSSLTLGFSRVVYAPIGPEASPFTATLARSLDAIFRWENLSGYGHQRSDQIGSIFARWVFAPVGFELYGEWARMDLPRSPIELFVAPQHTGGWTFGFQWAQPRQRHSWLRLQSELTYLEQGRVLEDRPTPDFYSGQASPQGYTQRGQVIGAAIGPGASSQWIAVDWLAERWQLGTFVGRIRWDNDALYRVPGASYFDHDVSVLGGARGAWRSGLVDFAIDLTAAQRYNYLFQNGRIRPGGYRTVDVRNFTLGLTATPR